MKTSILDEYDSTGKITCIKCGINLIESESFDTRCFEPKCKGLIITRKHLDNLLRNRLGMSESDYYHFKECKIAITNYTDLLGGKVLDHDDINKAKNNKDLLNILEKHIVHLQGMFQDVESGVESFINKLKLRDDEQ